MSLDVVSTPLAVGMMKTVGTNGSGYDNLILLTHYRIAMSMYDVSIDFF